MLTSNHDHVLNKNVVDIYIVYKLDPLASTRDKSFTIQNALFGAMQITKNATDNDKNNYKGYGICFDERSDFGHTITEGGRAHKTDARNVLVLESCKCVSKLNSSVCNNKQIWNDDTCRCDCNEDFAGMINCAKGCT